MGIGWLIGLLREIIGVGSCLAGEVRGGRIRVEGIGHASRGEVAGERVLIERGEEWIVVGGRVFHGNGSRR